MMTVIIPAVVSYLLGSIPTALVVVYFLSGIDVRSGGSGNMGAMNTIRMLKQSKGVVVAVFGFITVALLDMLKAVAAVIFCLRVINDFTLAVSIATVFVILGHNYPFFLKFKGGRGAASFMGILIYFNPKVFFIWLAVIVLFSIIFEFIQLVVKKKIITKKFIPHAVSEQILGRLVGELVGVYIIYLLDNRLLWPALLGTFLIVYSHKKRLVDQFKITGRVKDKS